jgi:hypothetical protein|tara:strand:+ start:125 stop:523 length:399 start_codon:yes stop_codon:yes gene_type:complete
MSFLKAFNNHLKEFITDITTVLPKDSELRTTKFFLEGLIKIKPSQIIKAWKLYIIEPYKLQINKGDYNFFLNKDYTNDIDKAWDDGNSNDILTAISRIRIKLKTLDEIDKKKTIKYVQNLSKLCELYHKDKL